MPSDLCFRLVHLKFLFTHRKRNYDKTVPKKVIGGRGSQQTGSELGHFLFYSPFKGAYCSSMDLEMGVCVRLREVKNVDF